MSAKTKRLKNWEEAAAELALYHELKCALDRKNAALADALRKVTESYREEIAELEAETEVYAAGLRAFATAHKKEFAAKDAGGEGRTRLVAGVEIGWRWGRPYVHIPKKFEAAAVAGLEAMGEGLYVKRSPKILRDVLNGQLLAAQEKGDEEAKKFIAALGAIHVTLDQDEEFVLEVHD